MPEIDPAQVIAVFAIVEVIRGLLPSRWLKIDGRIRVWTLVLAASVVIIVRIAPEPSNIKDLLNIAGDVLMLAVASVVANGAVVGSGLKEPVRKVVTIGGRIN